MYKYSLTVTTIQYKCQDSIYRFFFLFSTHMQSLKMIFVIKIVHKQVDVEEKQKIISINLLASKKQIETTSVYVH